MNNKALENLGYDVWFQKASRDHVHGDFSVARVVEVNKGNYRVSDGLHEMYAELSGKLMFSVEDSLSIAW